MSKLTAEKCKTLITNMHGDWEETGLSTKEELYLQALEIALPVLEQQGGWISCSERMPDVNDTVITSDGNSVNVCLSEASAKYRYFTGIVSGREVHVTYWQPLPAPPKPQPSTNPQIDNDGWIEWGGGDMPIDGAQVVQVKFRSVDFLMTLDASDFKWNHYGNASDIIAYRVIDNDGREG